MYFICDAFDANHFTQQINNNISILQYKEENFLAYID